MSRNSSFFQRRKTLKNYGFLFVLSIFGRKKSVFLYNGHDAIVSTKFVGHCGTIVFQCLLPQLVEF